MSPFRWTLIAVGAVVVIIFGVVFGIMAFRSTNYAEVQAQIAGVENGCVLSRSARSSTAQQRRRPADMTDFMTCDRAREMQRSGGYRDYQIRELQRLSVDYESPADGQQHRADVTTSRGFYPGAATGGTIAIRAHRAEPQSVLSNEGL